MPVLTRTNLSHAGDSITMDRQPRDGATLMEYLMMISLIVTVCLVGIGYFGTENNKVAEGAGAAINKSLKKGS